MPDVMPGAPDPTLRATDLSDLLQRHDLDFVRCAFVTVLGREADPTGERYYLQRLRAGEAKSKLLWQLRRSAEGLAHDPGIAGLDRYLRRAAWGRLPGLGWIVRRAFNTEPTGGLAMMNRVILNEQVRLRQQVAALKIQGPLSEQMDGDSNAIQAEKAGYEAVKRSLPPSARRGFEIMMGASSRANLN